MPRKPTPRSDAIWFIVHATVPDCEITLIDPATGNRIAGADPRRDRHDPNPGNQPAQDVAK